MLKQVFKITRLVSPTNTATNPPTVEVSHVYLIQFYSFIRTSIKASIVRAVLPCIGENEDVKANLCSKNARYGAGSNKSSFLSGFQNKPLFSPFRPKFLKNDPYTHVHTIACQAYWWVFFITRGKTPHYKATNFQRC